MDQSPLLAAVCEDDDESYFFSRNMQIIHNNNALMHILNSKRIRNDRPFSGYQYIRNILDGHPDRCYDLFRMNKTKFDILCQEILEKGIVRTQEITIEKQVAMFLQIVGQASSMRKTDDDFQRSLETLHRVFIDVLHSIVDMQDDYLKQPSATAPTHPSVREGTIYFPFKGALGAIDGTHVPAIVSKDKMDVHRNRKGFISQNVLAIVDFDMKFLYVCAGWEGSAQDMKVLRAALETGGFHVPSRRYYLADSGYANTSSFIWPYRNHNYHLGNFGRLSGNNRYRSAKDLFNHRHAQLRNVVERTFGVLKKRFKILTVMAPYKYKKQCRIVIACCILHNFIKFQNEIQNDHDKFLDASEEDESSSSDEDMSEQSEVDNTLGGEMLRTTMADVFWVYRQSQNQRRRNQRRRNQN